MTKRLEALERYEIMDTEPEADFDGLVQLAAQLCGTPIALVSLLDERRQWFKARVGLDVSETPLEHAFCRYALEDEGVMEVSDALEDSRFKNNQLVLGEPHIRFYAGAPLRTCEGQALGTLCVIDSEPRALTVAQRHGLEVLARQASLLLELRLQQRSLQSRTRELEELARAAPAVMLKLTMCHGGEPRLDYAGVGVREILGLDPSELENNPGMLWTLLGQKAQAELAQCLVESPKTGGSIRWEGWLDVPSGRKWFELLARSSQKADERVIWDLMVLDLTKRKKNEEQAIQARLEMRRLAGELSRAEETERHRIATGIHDDVGQGLTVLKLKLSELTRSEVDPGRKSSLQGSVDMVGSVLEKTRSLTFELSSPILFELGLEPALERLVEKVCKDGGVDYEFCDDHNPKPTSDQSKFIIYRSARELINNAVRHAKATVIRLGVSVGRGGIVVRVEDNGVGMETNDLPHQFTAKGGFGLFNVREQMEYLGGSCKVVPKVAGGTVLELWAPLSPG